MAELHLDGEAQAAGRGLHEVVHALVVSAYVGGHFGIERSLEEEHGQVVSDEGNVEALEPGSAPLGNGEVVAQGNLGETPLDLVAELYEQQNGQPLSGEQVRFAGELIEKIWEE